MSNYLGLREKQSFKQVQTGRDSPVHKKQILQIVEVLRKVCHNKMVRVLNVSSFTEHVIIRRF